MFDKFGEFDSFSEMSVNEYINCLIDNDLLQNIE